MKKIMVLFLLIVSTALYGCGIPGGGGDGFSTGTVGAGVMSQSYWAKTFGGTSLEAGYSVQQTSDGGFIVAGYTSSFEVRGSNFFVIKLDANGNTTWQKKYGSICVNKGQAIQQTSDGGYILAGYTDIFGAGWFDMMLYKLDANGDVVWSKTYGGTNFDQLTSIQQTSDGGYVLAGYTSSFGYGSYDVLVLKLDSGGSITWEKAFGGTGADYASSIRQTSDGGYIVAGKTSSFGAGGKDLWVIKLNSTGTVTWQNTYGGTADDTASFIQQTSDGGFILIGDTYSFSTANFYHDFWVIKLQADGSINWQKAYGTRYKQFSSSIQQTSDGGYILVGYIDLYCNSDNDLWLMKLDTSGTVIWSKSYGEGSTEDKGYAVQQTSDGGYIVVGETDSYGAGSSDLWVLKLKPDGTISSTAPATIGKEIDLTLWGYGEIKDTAVSAVASSATNKTTTVIINTQGVIGKDVTAIVQTQAMN